MCHLEYILVPCTNGFKKGVGVFSDKVVFGLVDGV